MPRGPAPRGLLLSCAAALYSAAALGQTPSAAFQDVIPRLATRIAATIAPIDRVRVAIRDGVAGDADREATRRAMVEALAAHGISLDDSPSAAIADVTCSEHIRGRICAADVRTGSTHYAIVEERRDDGPGAPAPYVPMALTLEPLFAQGAPILDAALAGSRLIVLDPVKVTEYERAASGWRLIASRPIDIAIPRPRDVRGRLRIDGTGLDAYLPGTMCRGSLDPLTLSCNADQRAWPIGIDNDGIAAGRNVFDDRTSGAVFVSAAPLGGDAGARWLVVSSDRRWVLMDDDHRPIDAPARDLSDASILRGDDVAAVTTGCAAGAHVIGSERAAANGADTLRIFRIAGRRVTPIGSPAIVGGRITALWTAPDPGRALVVTRREPGTYEAFFATVSCGR